MGPHMGPKLAKIDKKGLKMGSKHKIALFSIYEGTEALKPC